MITMHPDLPVDLDFSAVIPSFLREEKGGAIPFVRKPQPVETGPATNRKRILVIDDEQAIADSLSEILNDSGYDAHACYSGNEAIEFARKQCPDMVLSDVIMPRLNGIDTALAIKKICPRARIVLFSGQAGTTDLLESARAQGHKFELLPKPVHPEQLLKRLCTEKL